MNKDEALTANSGSLATAEIIGDLSGFVQLHTVQGSDELKHHRATGLPAGSRWNGSPKLAYSPSFFTVRV
jgi:hypothetical protein